MKKILLVALLLTVPACAGNPPPNLTPIGQAAVSATEVVKALDVIRDTSEILNTQGVLSLQTTNKIHAFHESVVKVIAAVPSGWKPTVLAAFDQLEKDLPAADWARIGAYVTLAKTLIASAA